LDTKELSLQVAEIEAGLRHANRREDANKAISELIKAAKENKTNLEAQVQQKIERADQSAVNQVEK
jgi:hypothetical protein